MKTVILDDKQVMTLEEVAAKLHEMYRWATHETCANKGVIRFTEKDGRRFKLDIGGFVHEVVGGRTCREPDPSRTVDFREDFDLVNMVWATDKDGNSVMVHD